MNEYDLELTPEEEEIIRRSQVAGRQAQGDGQFWGSLAGGAIGGIGGAIGGGIPGAIGGATTGSGIGSGIGSMIGTFLGKGEQEKADAQAQQLINKKKEGMREKERRARALNLISPWLGSVKGL
jgi:predicted lipid-binding transport protein (Tim44 family)